jgi:3-polyprenyl-4-hydroxybenzoate decarboxylase
MSTIQAANLVFESTGNTRIQYAGTNTVNIVAANNIIATVNSSSLSFQNNVVLGNSTVTVGLRANGSFGNPGEVLSSNGSATYWANVTLRVFDVSNTQVFP